MWTLISLGLSSNPRRRGQGHYNFFRDFIFPATYYHQSKSRELKVKDEEA
ncbi:hypothetical protein DsansV1_C11g0112891 [Dioscorea sansibarensis]